MGIVAIRTSGVPIAIKYKRFPISVRIIVVGERVSVRLLQITEDVQRWRREVIAPVMTCNTRLGCGIDAGQCDGGFRQQSRAACIVLHMAA